MEAAVARGLLSPQEPRPAKLCAELWRGLALWGHGVLRSLESRAFWHHTRAVCTPLAGVMLVWWVCVAVGLMVARASIFTLRAWSLEPGFAASATQWVVDSSAFDFVAVLPCLHLTYLRILDPRPMQALFLEGVGSVDARLTAAIAALPAPTLWATVRAMGVRLVRLVGKLLVLALTFLPVVGPLVSVGAALYLLSRSGHRLLGLLVLILACVAAVCAPAAFGVTVAGTVGWVARRVLTGKALVRELADPVYSASLPPDVAKALRVESVGAQIGFSVPCSVVVTVFPVLGVFCWGLLEFACGVLVGDVLRGRAEGLLLETPQKQQ